MKHCYSISLSRNNLGLPGQCRLIEHKTEEGTGKTGKKFDIVTLSRPVYIIKRRRAILLNGCM
jgi:hypothetical protein